MAKQVITTTEYTDDIDGSNASGTISFSWENVQYEIDLSKANARAFDKAVKPYIDASRKVRGSRGKASNRKPGAKHDLAAVRSWAKSAGYDVSQRGRVATAVIEAYEAAN
jgi:hypothetical protein